MLIKWFIHKIEPQNIFVFSKTAAFDLTYRPFWVYMTEHMTNPAQKFHIYESIDMDLIQTIVNKQKKIQKRNMATPKEDREEIKRLLFIYDDILGDA